MKIQAEFNLANLRKPRVALPLIGLIVIGSIGGVYGLQSLFTHTFNNPNGSTPIVTTTCSNVSTTATPVIGTSGTALFKCGTNPAITASAGSSTPTVTGLPAGWSLTLTPDSAPSCPGTTSVTNGSATTFTAGTYDYCEAYTNYAPPSPALTVTWSQ